MMVMDENFKPVSAEKETKDTILQTLDQVRYGKDVKFISLEDDGDDEFPF